MAKAEIRRKRTRPTRTNKKTKAPRTLGGCLDQARDNHYERAFEDVWNECWESGMDSEGMSVLEEALTSLAEQHDVEFDPQ